MASTATSFEYAGFSSAPISGVPPRVCPSKSVVTEDMLIPLKQAASVLCKSVEEVNATLLLSELMLYPPLPTKLLAVCAPPKEYNRLVTVPAL